MAGMTDGEALALVAQWLYIRADIRTFGSGAVDVFANRISTMDTTDLYAAQETCNIVLERAIEIRKAQDHTALQAVADARVAATDVQAEAAGDESAKASKRKTND